MGKSSNGPDEVDVVSMMAALSALHSGRVDLTMSLDGTGFVPTAVVRATMHFDVLPGSSLPPEVAVESKWPCDRHQHLWACVYHGLHQLDFQISKVYKQEELWRE
jgi:hypothetical protein